MIVRQEVDEAFDAVGREGHGAAVIIGPEHPDQPVFGFHFRGDVEELLLVPAELPRDERQGFNAIDFVHAHQAAITAGLICQFQRRSSSSWLSG